VPQCLENLTLDITTEVQLARDIKRVHVGSIFNFIHSRADESALALSSKRRVFLEILPRNIKAQTLSRPNSRRKIRRSHSLSISMYPNTRLLRLLNRPAVRYSHWCSGLPQLSSSSVTVLIWWGWTNLERSRFPDFLLEFGILLLNPFRCFWHVKEYVLCQVYDLFTCKNELSFRHLQWKQPSSACFQSSVRFIAS